MRQTHRFGSEKSKPFLLCSLIWGQLQFRSDWSILAVELSFDWMHELFWMRIPSVGLDAVQVCPVLIQEASLWLAEPHCSLEIIWSFFTHILRRRGFKTTTKAQSWGCKTQIKIWMFAACWLPSCKRPSLIRRWFIRPAKKRRNITHIDSLWSMEKKAACDLSHFWRH